MVHKERRELSDIEDKKRSMQLKDTVHMILKPKKKKKKKMLRSPDHQVPDDIHEHQTVTGPDSEGDYKTKKEVHSNVPKYIEKEMLEKVKKQEEKEKKKKKKKKMLRKKGQVQGEGKVLNVAPMPNKRSPQSEDKQWSYTDDELKKVKKIMWKKREKETTPPQDATDKQVIRSEMEIERKADERRKALLPKRNKASVWQ